ncbi:hypothetical protein AB0F24_27270 [Streptomyces platensis]|uniref:vWA-MoxR associated conflict system protein n=1 Tax=Streptomyces platensis TaxID=58346 RepID=UPI0033D03F8B
MTLAAPPRHLLVIAPQCPDLGFLDGLEEVADSLHTTLRDHWVGGCEDASPGMNSLLYGPSVVQAQIEKAVRDAAQRAGQAQAVLVLAFVGHGTTLGNVPRLFLMAGDSRSDEPTTVVNVGELLTQALDTQGVQGVIALVDTCHAGGATPDIASLDAGVRQGATRLSLLMSVGVSENAYGLAFTRGLVRVLRHGISGAGELLSSEDVRRAVNEATNTGARLVVADGDPVGRHPWLARNVRHRQGGGTLLGPVGEEDLRWALLPLGEEVSPLPISTPADLEDLRQRLHSRRQGGVGSTDVVTLALRVIDGLVDSIRTIDLLLSWPGNRLTTSRLKRAGRAAGGSTVYSPDAIGSDLLRACVESLRLRAPRVGGSNTAPLATFIATLAMEDGLGPDTPELSAWARAVGAVVELNDSFAALTEQVEASRLRLVVSLHAALADEWPETLLAWLLDHGEQVARAEFPCTPTQSGVEQQLAKVLKWASRQATQAGAQLKRIEIAAPSSLLVRWRPEETNLGVRLGVRHEVVLRWSDRLCPPDHLFWINDYARERLTAMKADCGNGAPVDWLGQHEISHLEELTKRLQNGAYEGALALSHRPNRLEEFMQHLLAYAPIVLWPESEGDLPMASRESVERYWDQLPGEFSVAYRHTWQEHAGQGDPAEGRANLARLRSVWHDTEWLDFCDWFETRSTDGENTV